MSISMADQYYLTDDILLLILKRLPPKALIKFLCVSKSWYTIITNPKFITSHLHHHHQFHDQNRHLLVHELPNHGKHQHLVSCYNKTNGTQCLSATLDLTDLGGGWSFTGCCNGIVCLYNGLKKYVCLWNPGIHKHLIIINPIPIMEDRIRLGFGYDFLTDEYKLVAISRDITYPHAQLYSVRTRTWKNVERPALPGIRFIDKQIKFVNGVIYWMIWGTKKVEHDLHEDCIVGLKFDVHEEVFNELRLPPNMSYGDIISLDVIDNSLAMVQPKVADEFVVWRMVDDDDGLGESWRILYRIKCAYQILPRLELCGNWEQVGVITMGFRLLLAFDKENPYSTNVVDGNIFKLPGEVFDSTESLALLDIYISEPSGQKGESKKDQEIASV